MIRTKVRGDISSLTWLIELAETQRAGIRQGPLFQLLERANQLEELHKYLGQLAHFSPMFISALCARAADGASPFSKTASLWRRHLLEEIAHPEQYQRWRQAHNVSVAERPTSDTIALANVCMEIAISGDLWNKILVLNLVAEGVALDTFTASIEAFERMGIDVGPGPFWRTHRTVDGDHLLMGLDCLSQVHPDSTTGAYYATIVKSASSGFDNMLASWA